jgi:predicted DNA-binding transcriptional regulator YafY
MIATKINFVVGEHLEIEYLNMNAVAPQWRRIEVVEVYKDYIKAFDKDRNAYRSFRRERITDCWAIGATAPIGY